MICFDMCSLMLIDFLHVFCWNLPIIKIQKDPKGMEFAAGFQ